MLLAPSILAADLADLRGAVGTCVAGGADLVHVDVMDGHFVPNLTFGIPVLSAMASGTDLPMDGHLMVSNPAELLDKYIAAGADWMSVHWEVTDHLDRLLGQLRDQGVKAGVALNPATPVEVVSDVLDQLDFVLLMSVNPGFAGQEFLPYVLKKAQRLRRMIEEGGHSVQIEMDGGIGEGNIGEVVASGVELCVAGSAIFGAADPIAAMARLRALAGDPA